MSQNNLGTQVGGQNIVDRRKTQNSATTPLSSTTYNGSKDVSSLDSTLNTANAVYYTQVRLDGMTRNDKIFALRTIYDPTGF